MVFGRVLRKVGGSLTLSLPQEVIRTYDLSPGDVIRWDVRDDGITIQFFKVTRVVTETVAPTPAERVMEAAE
jgi:antitoxin component of MazEF toxin-antitoxin module